MLGSDAEALCAAKPQLPGCRICEAVPELQSCSSDAPCLVRFGHADSTQDLEARAYGNVEAWQDSGDDAGLQISDWAFVPMSPSGSERYTPHTGYGQDGQRFHEGSTMMGDPLHELMYRGESGAAGCDALDRDTRTDADGRERIRPGEPLSRADGWISARWIRQRYAYRHATRTSRRRRRRRAADRHAGRCGHRHRSG